ncbi:MAG: hypothetical protein JO202_16830 [Ktedonobacteraceae bacterium]|nr:hypothetical protein [Ktedonobacteraceae bacterium]
MSMHSSVSQNPPHGVFGILCTAKTPLVRQSEYFPAGTSLSTDEQALCALLAKIMMRCLKEDSRKSLPQQTVPPPDMTHLIGEVTNV